MQENETSVRGRVIRELIAHVTNDNLIGRKIKNGELRKKLVEPPWKCPDIFRYTIIEMELASGVKSGKNTDKFSLMHLHTTKAQNINAPIIEECPVNIECKVRQIIPLGTHDCFVADIVGINAAKELLDSKGRLALENAGLLAYAHGEYFSLGKKLGSFGYSVRKKKNTQSKIHKKSKGK